MKFDNLTVAERVELVKREFSTLVKTIFEKPETLRPIIVEAKLSKDQSKQLLHKINSFNSKTCVCCRRFDSKKLHLVPVDPELELLVDVAQDIARKKSY